MININAFVSHFNSFLFLFRVNSSENPINSIQNAVFIRKQQPTHTQKTQTFSSTLHCVAKRYSTRSI